MYLKIIMIIASIGIMTAYPKIAMTQIRSISELKIVKELLSEEESAQYRSGRKSPSGAYRMERGKTGYTVIDNNTNYVHMPDVPGKVRKISWPKSEDRIAFDVSMIPVGERNYTGAVGVYFFKEKYTKIFRPDEYLLMNSKISPDGKMIVCTGSGYTKGYIIVIDIKTGNMDIITDIVSYSPSWLPNSNKVIYIQNIGNGKSIIVSADIKTGEKYKISENPLFVDFIVSPDGKSIAYSAPEAGTRNRDLYKKGLDGTGFVKIASNKILGEFYPIWSPDNNFIAYERPVISGHHEKTTSSEIYIYDLATKTERQLTNNPGAIHKVIDWKKDNRIVIKSAINDVKIYESYKIEQ